MIAQPGNRLLCLSWRPGHAPDRARLDALLAGWTRREGEGWLVASARADCLAETPDRVVALVTPRLFDRANARAMDAATVATAPVAAILPGLAPPSALCWREGPMLSAATDACGIAQIFVSDGGGIAAAASSATLLADLFGRAPDRTGLTGFALTGAFIDRATPFEGVAKLPAGHVATLADGTLEITAPPTPAPLPAAGLADVADAFRAAVSATLRAFPNADIELSGGLDSRLILAAVPPRDRAALRAMTIGAAGNEDVRIASRIARDNGMAHHLIEASDVDALPLDAFRALLDATIDGYDHGANPIDKLPLVHAGGQFRSDARFGGQNGEILRGFYHVGQPIEATPDEALARGLIRLRLRANDQVPSALLASDDFAAREAAVERALVERLMAMGGDTWGESLDRYYLVERMSRWVGASLTNAFVDRASLYPFFDADVLAAAMAVPPAAKRGNAFAGPLLERLDPALARVPLDGGRGPVAGVGPVARAAYRARRTAGKAADRIVRHLTGGSRGTLGSAGIVARWQREGLHHDLPFDRLAATGLIAPRALDEIAAGGWRPDRAGLGFVLLLSALLTRP